MAMPMLIRDVLPVGVTGIVIAAYFSAIMSTADSCLMASSGNFVNDVLQRYCFPKASEKFIMHLSQVITLVIGVAAVIIAAGFETVLDLIFDAYAFMVAGLFVPTVGAYFWKKSSSAGALSAMLAGGFSTLALLRKWVLLPESAQLTDLHPSAYGIAISLVVFVAFSLLLPDRQTQPDTGENHD
jgi:SSS family solute:Na+ symporter